MGIVSCTSHSIFAEKLTKNSASRAFQQTPIKHRRIVIANVGLQYYYTGHVSWKENEVISNDMWLINIHELVSTRLWKSTKSTWICTMVVWLWCNPPLIMLCRPTDEGLMVQSTVLFWMDWVMVWHTCSIPLFRDDHDDQTRVVRVYYPVQVFIIDWFIMFVNQT